MNHPTLLLCAVSLALAATPDAVLAQDAPSEEAIAFFEQNCMSCHTIGGGKLAGPDLKGANERRTEQQLVDFILDPKAAIDGGDPYTAELLRDARGVYMPKVPGLTPQLAKKLVALIGIESGKETSRFAGLQISDRPLTDADAAHGERLFRGSEPFMNGAPACLSCHGVHGVAGLGGGRLGPDLTGAYGRLEGRNGLAAWLGSPPSAVMQPVFKRRPLDGEEVLALVAYLRKSAESGHAEAEPMTLKFVLAGAAVSAFLLLLFDFLWRRRYRATRRPLTTMHRRRSPIGTQS